MWCFRDLGVSGSYFHHICVNETTMYGTSCGCVGVVESYLLSSKLPLVFGDLSSLIECSFGYVRSSFGTCFVGFSLAVACVSTLWFFCVDLPHCVVRGLGGLPSSSRGFVVDMFTTLVNV